MTRTCRNTHRLTTNQTLRFGKQAAFSIFPACAGGTINRRGLHEERLHGKLPATFTQFGDAARLVMRLADLEAQRCRRGCIDTEHLLLAIMQLHDCVAVRVLKKGGIDLDRVRNVVDKRAPPGDAFTTEIRQTLTPGCQKAIEYAIAAADRLGTNLSRVAERVIEAMQTRE